jgi:Amt family ammonium transporter
MTIESLLPALLGTLIPVGLFLLAWGGMEPNRARRSASAGALALALGTLGYFIVGFAFHLGGAGLMSSDPGLAGLTRLLAGQSDSDWGLIGLTGFLLSGDAATPEVFALFFTYLPLAASPVLLTVLSMSGRARGWQMVVGGFLVSAVLFPVAACWAWGGGWLASLGTTLERGHGFVDYGGSGVVYLLGGCAALGALIGLRYRLPAGSPDTPASMPPAHFPLLSNLGALTFGLGWLGWSLASPFHAANADINLPRLAVNGLLSASGAILATQTYCWFTVGHADALMSARGAAAGFVAIAAGAPFLPPWAALVVGVVSGIVLPIGVYLVERLLRLSDATATVALGISGGLWGLLAVALFADGRSGQGWNAIGPSEYHTVLGQGVTGFIPVPGMIGDGRGQMVAQMAGAAAICFLTLGISMAVFFLSGLPYRAHPRRQDDSPASSTTVFVRRLFGQRRGSDTETRES